MNKVFKAPSKIKINLWMRKNLIINNFGKFLKCQQSLNYD